MKKKILIWATEHCDLIWRRCFERPIEFKGQSFVSYSDLESYYIIDNVELCENNKDYRFYVESVAMLRKFLEKHPEYEEKIEKLIKGGQLEMPFSGDNIVDSNLVNGEGIVRNYLYGREYLKNKYDYVPYAVDRNDAFGNSAQLPQIIRGFGSKWIVNIGYSLPDNLYWRGLDGSRVLTWMPERLAYTGGYYKYRPCPVCNGFSDKDCPACKNRRVDLDFMENMRVKLPENLGDFDDTIPPQIYSGGEEISPGTYLTDWVKENSDKYDIEYGDFDHYIPYIQDLIDATDTVGEDKLHSSAEINCNNTGTFVTRINTKKTVRENEHELLTLETLAVAEALKDGKYPYKEIEKIWEEYFFTIFHDSITATHVDPAYEELMDCTRDIKKNITEMKGKILSANISENADVITVYNPYGSRIASEEVTVEIASESDVYITDADGNRASVSDYVKEDGKVTVTFFVADIDAFSKKCYNIVKTDETYEKEVEQFHEINQFSGLPVLTNAQVGEAEEHSSEIYTLENDSFKVTFTDAGIKEIFDKKLNRAIAEEGEYMVGEWILEHDEGSPWSTHSLDRRRQPLAAKTKLYKIEKTKDTQTAEFHVFFRDIDANAVMGIRITHRFTLKNGSDKVHFSGDIFWHTQNYRLRIAMPIKGKARHFYDIPYGVIERKPYENTINFADGSSNWASASGDYPAIHWAGLEKEDYSLALFNRGTPCYMAEEDKNGNTTMLLTPLRSPSLGSYLFAPTEYTMTDFDGMRDCGDHHFDYAIKAYEDGFDTNDAVCDGVAYNARLAVANGELNIASLPTLDCNDARISSLKMSQDRNGLIVRIAEYHGKDTKGTLTIPENIKFKAVYETDLKEDKTKELSVCGNSVSLDIRKFEIKTVYIEL